MANTYCVSIRVCLFILAALFYSRITGYDLGLRELFGNNKLIENLAFCFYVVIVLGGLITLEKRLPQILWSTYFSEIVNLLVAAALFGVFVLLLGVVISESFHIADILKLYISRFAFYILPVSILVLFFLIKRNGNEEKIPKNYIITGAVSFLVGVGFYIIKLQFNFIGNINAISQFSLVLLCLVLPLFYILYGSSYSLFAYRKK